MLVCWCAISAMAQRYHYYYRGEQLPLELNTQYAYLLLEGVPSGEALQQMLGDVRVTKFSTFRPMVRFNAVPGGAKEHTRVWAEVRFLTKRSNEAYLKHLDAIQSMDKVVHAAPYFSNQGEEKIGLSEFFMVKLKSPGDVDQLLEYATQQGATVIGQNKFLPLWYTLAVTAAAKANALDLANRFQESGKFAVSQPDLMTDDVDCVTDTYFANQWGLENTGTWGGTIDPDINACDAWANWGTGDIGTVIAVLDHGFEMNHPDLDANVIGTGYDTESNSSPALVLGSHGTACAGIVAAEGDNSQGVSGVAPDCGIMSISNSLLGNPTSRQARADGIVWAYTNGAAVISNSWSSSVAYAVIDDAISDAQTLGRGGLGTVIVFAAGNDNASSVSYPANANDDIIAVGAMSPCGERKNPSSCDGENWGSNYGTDLDVVAPGVKIPTTDRQGTNGYNTSAGTAGDYTQTFNGTSSACPHVAGLAGLIITMNHCLSQRQVCDIIEKTAQKTGSYTYSTTAGRDNGTWNNEMGYGLIDADAAMRMTRELYIQNMTITTTRVFQVHGSIFAGNNVDPTQTAGDVNLNAGADVDFLASTGITLDPGFNVNLGAIFNANIVNTSCANWNVNADFFRWANPSGATVSESGSFMPPMAARTEPNFYVRPNPFTQQLTVDYTITKPGPTSIQLYDLQGKVVKRVSLSDGQTAGMHREVIDMDGALPAGVYFLRMDLNGDSQIQKLIKQ